VQNDIKNWQDTGDVVDPKARIGNATKLRGKMSMGISYKKGGSGGGPARANKIEGERRGPGSRLVEKITETPGGEYGKNSGAKECTQKPYPQDLGEEGARRKWVCG